MSILRGKRLRRPDPRLQDVDPDLSFDEQLDRLRASHSGVAFIYSAMDLFVDNFKLNDLVVVVNDAHRETQIFRWGAKPISPDRVSLISAAPGVYCYPSLDDAEDAQHLFAMCQQAYIDLRSQGDTSGTYVPSDALRSDESRGVDDQRAASEIVDFEDPQIPGSEFGVESWRLLTSRAFVLIAAANIVLALFNVTGIVRFVLGLILGLAIPGWSIVGLFHFRDTALEIALSMATSIAVVMVSAQILITIHFWHLEAFEIFLCLVCLASLLRQAKWRWSPLERRR